VSKAFLYGVGAKPALLGSKSITANGTYLASGDNLDGYNQVEVAVAGSSTPSAAPSDINFYDYEGTLLYSYTIAEMQALNQLPVPPSHNGLTFQGWNWTLVQLQMENAPMDVGAMYITDDGKTRILISIKETARMNFPIRWSQTVSEGVEIEWGDGSAAETVSGTGVKTLTHAYAGKGNYTITLSPASGCVLGLGGATSTYDGVVPIISNENSNRAYAALVTEINIGLRVTTLTYSLSQLYGLNALTIPTNVTTIADYAIVMCSSLRHLTFPVNVISISGSYSLYGNYALKTVALPYNFQSLNSTVFVYSSELVRLTLPSTVNNIGNSVFDRCLGLSTITIPALVSVINSGTFSSCFSLGAVHLKRYNPPTLPYRSAFDTAASDCVFYVPVGRLTAYSTATNWTAFASRMVEE